MADMMIATPNGQMPAYVATPAACAESLTCDYLTSGPNPLTGSRSEGAGAQSPWVSASASASILARRV
jgi:hypothetical protein